MTIYLYTIYWGRVDQTAFYDGPSFQWAELTDHHFGRFLPTPSQSRLVFTLVSIMRRPGDLFHIWTFTVHRTVSSPS